MPVSIYSKKSQINSIKKCNFFEIKSNESKIGMFICHNFLKHQKNMIGNSKFKFKLPILKIIGFNIITISFTVFFALNQWFLDDFSYSVLYNAT